MKPIICNNNIEDVINSMQDYLEKGGIIKGVRLVDCSEKQTVILIDEKNISQEVADAWWNGFNAFIGEQG